MNPKLRELAQWAGDAATKAGAQQYAVTVGWSRFVNIEYRQRKPETVREAVERRLALSLYVNGRFSLQSTNDLRPQALQDFIAEAVAATKLLAEDPYRTLPDPKYYQGRAALDLQLADPAYAAATTEKRHALVREMEAACLEAGGDKLVSVTATGQDSRAEYVRLTSNGFTGEQETTNFNGGADATVQDEGDRRPNGYSWASSRRQNGLPAPAEIGREAARRTLALLGAKKIPTATLPIVVENRIAGRLVGELLAPLSGQAIQQKRSCLADKKGQKIGSERLTLIADPLVVGGLGSRLFDGDGMAAKKRTIVEGGVVKDFLVDWYYSRKLGCEPTTGSTGNLILPPGPRSVAELMKALGRGILITDFLGGNSNSTTGDFSVGIMGKLFENGEPVQSVAEMNIADNHLRFWQKLAEAANDPWPYSAMRLPSLVFDGVVVAGK